MKRVMILSVVLALLMTMCVGCSGVSAEEYEALQTEHGTLKTEYATLKDEHDTLQMEYDTLEYNYESLQSEYDALVSWFLEDPEDEQAESSSGFDAGEVISELGVTEYLFGNEWSYYAVLVIANPSDYTIELSANVQFYNADNALVGAQSEDSCFIESGTEAVMVFWLDEEADHMDYEFAVLETDTRYRTISGLSYESTTAADKEVVSVTNNLDEPLEYVDGMALFFKDGELVHFSGCEFVDVDGEQEPGKTLVSEALCYDEYDSVQFFFTGYKYY